MNYFQFWIRQNFLTGLCRLGIISWAITASIFALRNNTIVIEISENGSRIIDGNSDTILNAEAVRFVKLYLNRSFNFDRESFNRNLGEVSSMMSRDLWDRQHTKIISLIGHVESNQLTQSGIIERITRPSSTKYEALISVKQKTRAKVLEYQIKISLQLARVKRTEINPWGLEVVEDTNEKI